MARKSKWDRAFDACFYANSHGVQFNIMDLSKLRRAVNDATLSGVDLESAVKAAIQVYRTN
jgi:hypothetical protein